jgi:rubredoxin
VQDWRGRVYEVARNRWEYLCPDCADGRDYLSRRGMDDVECPECGSVHDVERVGLHDVNDRRRRVLACNECGHVYTRPASRAHVDAARDLYQYLVQDCYQPLPASWVMVPSPSTRDDEVAVVVHHARGEVERLFRRLPVEYEVEEIRDRVWVFRVAEDDVREVFDTRSCVGDQE